MIIDGKQIAENVNMQTKDEISKLTFKRKAKLAILLIGNNEASLRYINGKIKKGEELGIDVDLVRLDEGVDIIEVLGIIKRLNYDDTVDGIILQLPLPESFKTANEKYKNVDRFLIEKIDPQKDIDGLTPLNISKYVLGDDSGIAPATAVGVMKILEEIKVDLQGKDVVILGRSLIVGKPLAEMLVNKDAAVSVLHSKVPDISKYTKRADIVISAVGKRNILTSDMIMDGVIVIDVGINKDENEKLVGDVDFENIKDKCSFITPVPGGVGPLTIAYIMRNVLKAYINHNAS